VGDSVNIPFDSKTETPGGIKLDLHHLECPLFVSTTIVKGIVCPYFYQHLLQVMKMCALAKSINPESEVLIFARRVIVSETFKKIGSEGDSDMGDRVAFYHMVQDLIMMLRIFDDLMGTTVGVKLLDPAT